MIDVNITLYLEEVDTLDDVDTDDDVDTELEVETLKVMKVDYQHAASFSFLFFVSKLLKGLR